MKLILCSVAICAFICYARFAYGVLLVTAPFDKELAIQQVHIAQEAMTVFSKSLSDSDYEQLRSSILSLIQTLSPRERRIAALEKRMVEAQKETADYVARKNYFQTPIISFIIPVHNRQSVVRDSLKSILDYKWPIPWEVVVVDDGSTDKTYTVLLEYEKKFENLFVYRHEQNMGAPAARNTAILHARGKYIFNLDSDDIALPEAVLYMFDAVEKSQLEHAYFGEYHFFMDFDTKKLARVVELAHKRDLYDIFDIAACRYVMHLPASIGCRLFTKKSWACVGGFIEDRGHDNWAFSYLQCAAGMPACFVNKLGYLHRFWSNKQCMTQQTVSHNWDVSPMIAVREYDELLSPTMYATLPKLLEKNGAFFIKFICQHKLHLLPHNTVDLIHAMNRCIEEGKFEKALQYFRQTIRQGACHINVYLSGLKAALYVRNMPQVNQLLEQISAAIVRQSTTR
jgi:glycosyltransferase involved in cell wall biosynthesis